MSVIDIQIIILSVLAQHTNDVVRRVSLIELKVMTQKETKNCNSCIRTSDVNILYRCKFKESYMCCWSAKIFCM